MLHFECSDCGHDEESFEFDYKTRQLHVICNNCGFTEFITTFKEEKKC